MEDQRAHPAKIVSPSVNEGSHKPRQARNARRNARETRELPVKNRHAFLQSVRFKSQRVRWNLRPIALPDLMYGRKFRSTESSGLAAEKLVEYVS